MNDVYENIAKMGDIYEGTIPKNSKYHTIIGIVVGALPGIYDMIVEGINPTNTATALCGATLGGATGYVIDNTPNASLGDKVMLGTTVVAMISTLREAAKLRDEFKPEDLV